MCQSVLEPDLVINKVRTAAHQLQEHAAEECVLISPLA